MVNLTLQKFPEYKIVHFIECIIIWPNSIKIDSVVRKNADPNGMKERKKNATDRNIERQSKFTYAMMYPKFEKNGDFMCCK